MLNMIQEKKVDVDLVSKYRFATFCPKNVEHKQEIFATPGDTPLFELPRVGRLVHGGARQAGPQCAQGRGPQQGVL